MSRINDFPKFYFLLTNEYKNDIFPHKLIEKQNRQTLMAKQLKYDNPTNWIKNIDSNYIYTIKLLSNFHNGYVCLCQIIG